VLLLIAPTPSPIPSHAELRDNRNPIDQSSTLASVAVT
jgi:hypothetical protein